MAPGMRHPLYAWPNIGPDNQTFDKRKMRHVYPDSKYTRPPQDMHEIESVVQVVMDQVDYSAGNIASYIARDLASPASRDDLALLPKADPITPRYAYDITEACLTMMRAKIQQHQREYGADLGEKERIDIVVLWDCPKVLTDEHVRWVPPHECAIVKEAYACHYKHLNWDAMHADEKEHDCPDKRQPGECRRPKRPHPDCPPSPPPLRKGGFYACVSVHLYRRMALLSSSWGITTWTVVAPRYLTPSERDEAKQLSAARRTVEEAARAEVEKEAQEAEQKKLLVEEQEWRERRANTYGSVLEAEARRRRFQRVNVHVDQGAFGGISSA